VVSQALLQRRSRRFRMALQALDHVNATMQVNDSLLARQGV
jgi:hypothetical protein